MTTDQTNQVPAVPDSRFILQTKVNQFGYLMVFKDGLWEAAGKCINCGDLGQAHSHCKPCDPLGFLCNPFNGRDDIVVNPKKLGAVAHLVHFTISGKSDPAAAHLHLHFLLESLWLDDQDKAASDSPHIVKTKYNKNKKLLVYKYGMWKPAGECIN
jgi:hypothetical protein